MANHYRSVFSCLEYEQQDTESVVKCFNETKLDESYIVSHGDIYKAINCLSNGKSAGLDCLNAEHFKYISKYLVAPVYISFSSMFVHGYLPTNTIKSCLLPILKVNLSL